MTVTIEVKNQGTLNLLQNLEGLGLIHIQAPVFRYGTQTVTEDASPNRWLRGCCKDLPEGSVDNFLAHCRADKEREIAIEKRQEEERARRA
jgi:hypothetical protein